MKCPPTFHLRVSQKVGGHLIVIIVPYMVKIGHFWSSFAQSQPKKRCPAAISSSLQLGYQHHLDLE